MTVTSVEPAPPAPGADAPLENYANNVSPPSPRSRRYERRAALWALSELPRLRKCGRVRRSTHVGVRTGANGAGFSGLCSCGSVWACPVCNAKIMARRALELGAAIATWTAMGGRIGFVTLTMRHHQGHGLSELWNALADAWRKVVSGKVWTKQRRRVGMVGFVRAVEVTHGRNGWHVHVHALLFLDGACTTENLAELHSWMFGKWSNALQRKGFDAPLMAGQDARLVAGVADADLSAYLSKSTDLGLELTQSQSKRARKAHATVPPWETLTEVLAGDADALDRWHVWEAGSKGRRQLTWSWGLRELLQLTPEATDEDIAAEEAGDRDLVLIPGEVWDADLVRRPHLIPLVLDAAEKSPAHLRRFLERNRIPFEEVPA